MWQEAWSDRSSSRRRTGWTLALIATLYGISGIRWYFGLIAAVACVPFFVLTILRTSPRAVRLAAAAGIVPGLFVAVLIGSGPTISPMVHAIVNPHGSRVLAVPRAFFKYLDRARAGFESTGGGTMIGAGRVISAVDAQLGNSEQRFAPNSLDPKAALTVIPQPAQALPAAGPHARMLSSKPAVANDRAGQPVSSPDAMAAPGPARMTLRTGVNGRPGVAAGTVAIPASHATRLLAGTAAMVLPRTVAQRLGILDVRGGRGLWLFVEIDTIVFDVICVFCAVAIIRAVRRRELHPPVFWLILMVTVVIGGLLAYTVSNFGTLFRHREMVLLGLLMLPLAALPARDTVPEP
jgi:hypothetical protein